MADDERSPEDEFQELLRNLLGGQAGLDPEQLQQLSGLGIDPAMMVYNHLNQPRELVQAEPVLKLFG